MKQIQSKNKDINSIFNLNTALQKCVLFLVKKLQEIGSLRTFIKTKDGYNSAHFEHTIAIRENGPEILSRSQLNG